METLKFGPMYNLMREKAGVSRQRVLQEIKRSQVLLSRIEKGQITPNDEVFQSLVSAIGIEQDSTEYRKLERAIASDRKAGSEVISYPNFSVTLSEVIEASATQVSVLASEIGVTQTAINRWKHGFSAPSGARLNALVDVFIQRGVAKDLLHKLREDHTFDGLMKERRFSHLSDEERYAMARRFSSVGGGV